MEGPPAKKRRFFAESTPTKSHSHASSNPGLPDQSGALLSRPSLGASSSDDGASRGSSNSDGFPASQAGLVAFDKDTLESFVGEAVPPETLEKLREASGNDMERAVNMYLDGSWNKQSISRSQAFAPASALEAQNPPNTQVASFPESKMRRQSISSSKYIGAFGVNAWATKSSTSSLKHGEIVRIERQKIQPPKAPLPKGRGRPAAAQLPKPNSAAAKRVDVIVRFTNSKGEEIGRIPREVANWVSVLIDQKVCKFEGTCVCRI